MVVSPVIIELNLADELNFDTLMFKTICFAVKGNIDLNKKRFKNCIEVTQIKSCLSSDGFSIVK